VELADDAVDAFGAIVLIPFSSGLPAITSDFTIHDATSRELIPPEFFGQPEGGGYLAPPS
jgi:hypothetical protein